MSEPRRIGEILDPTLAGLQDSDQARAYAAWALAAGEQVTAAAAPRGFRRGVLTVDCLSDHFHVLLSVDHDTQRLADELMVVTDENPDLPRKAGR